MPFAMPGRTVVNNTTFKAIGWMLFSGLSTSVMVALVRFLSADMHVTQILFFRNFMALLVILPWCWHVGLEGLKTTRITLYSWRLICGFVGMGTWFYAVTVVPLPLATALSFSSPLFTALLAIILLGERFGIHRWGALLLGFTGVWMVLRPGTEYFDMNALIVIFSTIFWAASGIIIRRLTETDSPRLVVFYFVVMMTPCTFLLALPFWEPVPMKYWGWLVVLGIVSNFVQVGVSNAISLAPFTVILPFDFARLLFVTAIAYIAFGESLDLWVFIGALVIMGSAVYTTYRDARMKRKRVLITSEE